MLVRHHENTSKVKIAHIEIYCNSYLFNNLIKYVKKMKINLPKIIVIIYALIPALILI